MSIFSQNPITEEIESTEEVEKALAAVVTETAAEVTEVTEVKEEVTMNEKKGIFKKLGEKASGIKAKVNTFAEAHPVATKIAKGAAVTAGALVAGAATYNAGYKQGRKDLYDEIEEVSEEEVSEDCTCECDDECICEASEE